MLTRIRFPAWFALVATLVVSAADTSAADTPIERALAAITTDRILADLFYVACDDMGGRATPSVGQRLTARFIKNRLQRIGWQPGATSDWLQSYPLKQRALDQPSCKASVHSGERTIDLALADDYSFPPLAIASLDVRGGVVYVGKIPSDAIDPKTSAALHGRWAWFTDKGGDLDALDTSLRQAGAIGVLTTVEILNTGGDPQAREVFKMFAEMTRSGVVSWPSKNPTLPRVYLPKKTIDKLLAMAGASPLTTGDVLPFSFSETRRAASDDTIQAENVVGFWPGGDADLAKQVVIVSAHYDHLGWDKNGRAYNGADDNGSGVVALLALAEALAAHGPLECSVLLVWVSGEEKGLWGSQAFVDHPCLPRDCKPVASINLDMVGRNAATQLSITPFATTHASYCALAKLAADIARDEGFTDLKSADQYFHRSDNYNFAKLGIPVVSLEDDMTADYHQPSDTPEKIDGDKIRRVTRMVLKILTELQDDPAERAR